MTSSLEGIRQVLTDYARDIKLNLGTLMGSDGAPELSKAQKWGVAVEASRTAAAIMAMTIVYYRAIHMAADPELSRLPAGLRMNGLTRHSVDQGDLELFGLAASLVKGCESCAKAHADGAKRHGVSVQAVQTAIRIAAVIHAAATALDAEPDPSTLRRHRRWQRAAG